MKLKTLTLVLCSTLIATQTFASGYGVFTQGASGLGQANAVVAHPTGPSSIYFNPALLNDVPGRQLEVGTTAVYSKREIDLDSGGTEKGDSGWNFPSSFYYTHNGGGKFTAGIGVFFPFGLSNEWDKNYEGRYIGTKGEMFSMNINPAFSMRVTDKLSLAAGLDFVFADADQHRMINQGAAYQLLSMSIGPLPDPVGPLNDVEQKFSGDGWGHGFNLGALYKATDRISIGAAYRSQVNIDLDGSMTYTGEDPVLALAFLDGNAETEIKLPAQFVAAVATSITDDLIVEVGVRWEDWSSIDKQSVDLQYPFLGDPSMTTLSQEPDWHSTWTYNIGAHYQVNDAVALNAGYLYAENAVPDSTFEPIIPDTDAHLFTVGAEWTSGPWTVAGAVGYEYHDSRRKNNNVKDELGSAVDSYVASLIAGSPVAVASGTANGEYNTDIYLVGLSVGYSF